MRLLGAISGFRKAYLSLLVDEIRLDGNEPHNLGSYRAPTLAVSLSNEGRLGERPSFVHYWRAQRDSNYRPLGS